MLMMRHLMHICGSCADLYDGLGVMMFLILVIVHLPPPRASLEQHDPLPEDGHFWCDMKLCMCLTVRIFFHRDKA